jgi:hypothetical protein
VSWIKMHGIKHLIAHWLGLNGGRVISGYDEKGSWVAFRCSACGHMQGKSYIGPTCVEGEG